MESETCPFGPAPETEDKRSFAERAYAAGVRFLTLDEEIDLSIESLVMKIKLREGEAV